MIKKENKIFVVISPDPVEREQLIARLAVRLGFAKIPSDALKIISKDIYSFDLATAYFVLCSNYHSGVLSSQHNGCMSLQQEVYVFV